MITYWVTKHKIEGIITVYNEHDCRRDCYRLVIGGHNLQL